MAYGLQIWNSTGQMRLDTSHNSLLQINYYTGTGSADPEDVTVTGMNSAWSIIDFNNQFSASIVKGVNKVILNGYIGKPYAFGVIVL